MINSDVTLSGGPNDVWILQIAGNLNIASGGDIASGIKVKLVGGARAANVFWQVAGVTTLGTYSTFNGTILDEANIALQTGAVLNGRALAQTAVTLQQNAITITAETKTQCQAFLNAEKTVFNNGQKADLQAFTAAQAAAKQAFLLTHPTAAQQTAFNNQQKTDLQVFQAGQKTALQVFQAGQNAAKQAFAAEQKIDMQECNTLQ